MIPRVTFFLIAAFWVTMNVLLWRAEYGSHGSEHSRAGGSGLAQNSDRAGRLRL